MSCHQAKNIHPLYSFICHQQLTLAFATTSVGKNGGLPAEAKEMQQQAKQATSEFLNMYFRVFMVYYIFLLYYIPTQEKSSGPLSLYSLPKHVRPLSTAGP